MTKDYSDSVRLDPNDVTGHREFARLLATCREPKSRDGKRAVELTTRACELSQWKDAACLDALAAAYAETGDFPAAVKWQTEAIQRHPIGRVPVLDNGRGFHGRLREYQRGQPTREYGSISVVVCFPTGETASSHLYSARGKVIHFLS